MNARAAALLLAAAVGVGACTEVTESQPLPWLKVKKTFHKPIGGFAGGTSDFEYYTKRFGFWWVKVDETATGTSPATSRRYSAASSSFQIALMWRSAAFDAP